MKREKMGNLVRAGWMTIQLVDNMVRSLYFNLKNIVTSMLKTEPAVE